MRLSRLPQRMRKPTPYSPFNLEKKGIAGEKRSDFPWIFGGIANWIFIEYIYTHRQGLGIVYSHVALIFPCLFAAIGLLSLAGAFPVKHGE